jgi:hypothetical protein
MEGARNLTVGLTVLFGFRLFDHAVLIAQLAQIASDPFAWETEPLEQARSDRRAIGKQRKHEIGRIKGAATQDRCAANRVGHTRSHFGRWRQGPLSLTHSRGSLVRVESLAHQIPGHRVPLEHLAYVPWT